MRKYWAVKLTSVQNQVEKIAARLEEKLDDDTESIITNERYEAITCVVKCVKRSQKKLSRPDKIDQIVTKQDTGTFNLSWCDVCRVYADCSHDHWNLCDRLDQ